MTEKSPCRWGSGLVEPWRWPASQLPREALRAPAACASALATFPVLPSLRGERQGLGDRVTPGWPGARVSGLGRGPQTPRGASAQPPAGRGAIDLPAAKSWPDIPWLAVLRVGAGDVASRLHPGEECPDLCQVSVSIANWTLGVLPLPLGPEHHLRFVPQPAVGPGPPVTLLSPGTRAESWP